MSDTLAIVLTRFRTLLRSPDVQKDPRRYLQAVQKVIACMTLGIDVSKLFSEMIMVSEALTTPTNWGMVMVDGIGTFFCVRVDLLLSMIASRGGWS